MSWVRGTATFTNGSTAVTATDADWIAAAVAPGDAVLAPDGRTYEVDTVLGARSLTLARPYAGPTVDAGDYDIAPLQERSSALARAVNQLVTDYQGMLDGAGAGRFDAGTAGAPGVTFTNDTDTGFFNPAPNVLGVGAGGAEVLRALPGGLAVGPGVGNLGGGGAPRVHVLESDQRAGIGVRSHRSSDSAGVRGLQTTLLQGSGANGAFEGNVSLRFWHNDYNNLSGRLVVHTRGDDNGDAERISVDHNSLTSHVQLRALAGTVSAGTVYVRGLVPDTWTTLAIIPKAGAGEQKSVQFRLQVHVEENGGICPFELAGFFYDRSNALPHPDIINFAAIKPFGDLQGAAALTQFRLTTLGVPNGQVYLQVMNPVYHVGVYVLKLWNNWGMTHFNWQ